MHLFGNRANRVAVAMVDGALVHVEQVETKAGGTVLVSQDLSGWPKVAEDASDMEASVPMIRDRQEDSATIRSS